MVRFASIQSPTLSPAPEPVRMVEKTYSATMPTAALASPDVSVAEVMAEISRQFDESRGQAVSVAETSENAATARQEAALKAFDEGKASAISVFKEGFDSARSLAVSEAERANEDRADKFSALSASVSDLRNQLRLEKGELLAYMERETKHSKKIVRRFSWALAVIGSASLSILITITAYVAGI